MAGLAHEFGEAGAPVAGRRDKPGAQAVSRVTVGIEPGVQRRLLDQAGDRLVGQLFAGDPAGLRNGAERRAFGTGCGAGGRVEIRGGTPVREPDVGRGEGAETPGSCGLARTAMAWAWPVWSVLERRTRTRSPRRETVSASPRVRATSSERRRAARHRSRAAARDSPAQQVGDLDRGERHTDRTYVAMVSGSAPSGARPMLEHQASYCRQAKR